MSFIPFGPMQGMPCTVVSISELLGLKNISAAAHIMNADRALQSYHLWLPKGQLLTDELYEQLADGLFAHGFRITAFVSDPEQYNAYAGVTGIYQLLPTVQQIPGWLPKLRYSDILYTPTVTEQHYQDSLQFQQQSQCYQQIAYGNTCIGVPKAPTAAPRIPVRVQLIF